MKQWEKMILERRKEFKKSLPHLETQKKDLIQKMILEKPSLNLEDLEKYLKDNGMLGLSLKEKLDVLRKQISLLLALCRNYKQKMDKFIYIVFFFLKLL